MVSTFTPNIQLEEPARGDDVGVWDTPVNNNMSLIDKVAGAIATIALNNSPIVLSAAQFQSRQITFNSTLTGAVSITFPTSFSKSYDIQNLCTGSSAFVITLATTAAGGQVVCCPPGEIVDVVNDGTNIKFKNLGRTGSYMDYGGSSVPAWISGCTVPPYLNCDGSGFSAVTYPALAIILGGTTLPDIRGTAKYTLNQGTGRLTAAGGALDGNTILSVKTTQTITIATQNLPPYTPTGTVQPLAPSINNYTPGGGGLGAIAGGTGGATALGLGSGAAVSLFGAQPLALVLTGGAQGGTSTPMSAIGTGTVIGITMIRSA